MLETKNPAGETGQKRFHAPNSTNPDRIRKALPYIDAHDRDTWVKVGMAIKSELGDAGFDLWDDWSRSADNYNSKDARDVWRSIDPHGGIGIGTLFHLARRGGWVDEERQREQAEAADKAQKLFDKASQASSSHPYLVRKGVVLRSHTLREIDAGEAKAILGYLPKAGDEALSGRLLVVPIQRDGRLCSLELIDEAGRKTALRGRGTRSGGYWATDPLPEGDGAGLTLLIGEGVATVLSASLAIEQAFGCAALSNTNLMPVAQAMRCRYPKADLVILADLEKATGKPDRHAIEAARAVGARLAIPTFRQRAPEQKDFNDLHQAEGHEAVARCIKKATDPAPIPFLDAADRPCFAVLDDPTEWNGRKLRAGVYYCGISEKRDAPPTPYEIWICSPLHIEAITFDEHGGNFGRLLRFKNSLGQWREWAMPMELLRGSGEELRGELLAMGVELELGKARSYLPAYLQSRVPDRKMRCASRVGWVDRAFVLPDAAIGPGAEEIVFQSGERSYAEFAVAGTLADWQASIARKASANPLLMLALSAAFAGPLLAPCHAEGGGLHFVGDSSTGKTTLIQAACSVWGGPDYRRSWRATSNGLEGAAALFNDCLLALDEISECHPREVGAIVYALGNGIGKQRASRTGAARVLNRWRCLVLSSGERGIAASMAEGGRRVKAGQTVRLLDVPVARKHGAFDDLHGAATAAAFADGIKTATSKCYGAAGRTFLKELSRDTRDFCALLERCKALPQFDPGTHEGQAKRAAARFALIGLAGELATEYGITGWAEKEAIRAAAEAFRLWQGWHGKGNDERRQIAEAMADFIDRHGDARFSDIKAMPDVPIRDRAGWWRDGTDGREYLFTAPGLREALTGFDFKRALDALQEIGALPAPGATGERARFLRINGRGVKLYPINPAKLTEGL